MGRSNFDSFNHCAARAGLKFDWDKTLLYDTSNPADLSKLGILASWFRNMEVTWRADIQKAKKLVFWSYSK